MKNAVELVNQCNAKKITTLSDIAADFFTPACIVTLASLINQGIIPKKGEIQCSDKVKTYLEKINFFKCINDVFTYNCFTQEPDDFIGITPIHSLTKEEYTILYQRVHQMIMYIKKLEDTKENRRHTAVLELAVSSVFAELLRNVLIHSRSDFSQKGCLFMMQYYSAANILHFAVIDSGAGIAETLKSAYHKPQEKEDYYMLLAFKKNHTENSTLGAGNGLFLCSRIVEKTVSKMQIASRNNYFERIGQKIIHNYNQSNFPGTLINVEFNIDVIEKDAGWLDQLLTEHSL